MRAAQRSPLGARIDAVTQKVEEALRNLPSLLKNKNHKSPVQLRIPKSPGHCKPIAVDAATQNTDRSRLSSCPAIQLHFGDLKSHLNTESETTQNTSMQKPFIEESNSIPHFRSYGQKLSDLDISGINQNYHPEHTTVPSSHISPINRFQKSPIHNFKSLCNLDISSRDIFTTPNDRTRDVCAGRSSLSLLEVAEHQGYRTIQEPAQENKRRVISQQMKHRVAMKIRQRVQYNKTSLPGNKKHSRDLNQTTLRDALIRRVAAIGGLIC